MRIGALSRPSGPHAREPDWRLRLRVRVARRILDQEIAAGAGADESPARALRARQLSTRSERRAIATCLSNILDAAEECRADPGTRVVLNHDALLAGGEIIALIDLLRSDSVLRVRGIALARLLTEDHTSPLLRARTGRTPQQALSEILDAL